MINGEQKTCFYCNEKIVGPGEMDHFPIPAECKGDLTVPSCKDCHDSKDRLGILKWEPELVAEIIADFPKLSRGTKIFLAKCIRMMAIAVKVKHEASKDLGITGVGAAMADGDWEVLFERDQLQLRTKATRREERQAERLAKEEAKAKIEAEKEEKDKARAIRRAELDAEAEARAKARAVREKSKREAATRIAAYEANRRSEHEACVKKWEKIRADKQSERKAKAALKVRSQGNGAS